MPSLILPKWKHSGKPTRVSPVYHIRYHCPIRRRSWIISTKVRNKRVAQTKLAEFTRLLEEGAVGLENPFKIARASQAEIYQRLDLVETLKVYEKEVANGMVRTRGKKGPLKSDHAATSVTRIRKVLIDTCKFTNLRQITKDAVRSGLDRLQAKDGLSARTRHHYERHLKSFSKWCAGDGERLASDPLANMRASYVAEAEIVHGRAALSTAEVNAIIASAEAGPDIGALTGPQRALYYRVLAYTGFRAIEAAAIRAAFFDEQFTFVSLSSDYTKNGKAARQPIPRDLGTALKAFCRDLPPEAVLFPVPNGMAVYILRADAKRCGIMIGREGKKQHGGLVKDAHSFRHHYASWLEARGVSPGEKARLMRSTPGMAEHYTHHDDAKLLAAVGGVAVAKA